MIHTFRTCWLSCLLITLAVSVHAVGQSSRQSKLTLKIYRDGRAGNFEVVRPGSLAEYFADQKALSQSVKIAATHNTLLESLLNRVELVQISRYRTYRASSIASNHGEIYSGESHPRFFPAIVHRKQIYIFNREDETASVAVFNQLVDNLAIAVRTTEWARQLAEFYLLLYSNNFRDPTDLIISRIEDIPEKYRVDRPEPAESIRPMIRPLQVAQRGDLYDLEFFTWENLPRGEVIKWQMIITFAGKLEVRREIVGMI